MRRVVGLSASSAREPERPARSAAAGYAGTPLRSRPDPLQRFQDLRVLRLQPAVDRDALRGILTEEDQSVTDVVGLIDRLGKLLHQPALRFRTDPLRCLDKQDRHMKLPSPWSAEPRTCRTALHGTSMLCRSEA